MAPSLLKRILGEIPLSAEAMETIRPSSSELEGCFRLDRLEGSLPGWIKAVEQYKPKIEGIPVKNVLIVANLSWWFEYCVSLALLLSGLGNKVELVY
ncbi:MAG: hypothetical protein KAH97_07180, partial [Anaerolineales bacterium]|nr:hypothetical protein [Anaerolineales bacterium]